MSHLHVPDGVFPLWLVTVGWLLTFALLTISILRARRFDLRRRVPLLGATAALMLVAMSSEIVPIAYHINLTLLGGILLGPALSPIAAFVVVTALALIGHGGVTVIGLNTIVIAAEMIVGWALFGGLTRLLGRRRAAWASAIATVCTLAITTTLVVGIVAIGGSGATARESGAFDPASLSFGPLGSERWLSSVLVSAEEEPVEPVRIGRFAAMVYTLGSIGWVLEALITGAIVGFVARVRPSLLFEGAVVQPPRPAPGDEGAHH